MADEKKSQGFTIVSNEIFELKIKPISKLVYITLIKYNNKEKGYSYPSQKMLMEDCNLTNKTTLINAINELEEKGIIKKECIKGKGNKYYLTSYECVTSSEYVTSYESVTTPVTKVQQHQLRKCNTTNTNINTNTITNNNMSDFKKSDAPPGAFKSDNKKTTSSKRKKPKKVFEESSIEYQLSEKLYQYVLEAKPKTKEPDLQKWSKDFDLILRKDERSLEDLENVIDWIFNGNSNSSNFWKKNIASPGALRGTTKNGADKFAEIYSQMENDNSYTLKQANKSYLEDTDVDLSIEDIIKINLGETNNQ